MNTLNELVSKLEEALTANPTLLYSNDIYLDMNEPFTFTARGVDVVLRATGVYAVLNYADAEDVLVKIGTLSNGQFLQSAAGPTILSTVLHFTNPLSRAQKVADFASDLQDLLASLNITWYTASANKSPLTLHFVTGQQQAVAEDPKTLDEALEVIENLRTELEERESELKDLQDEFEDYQNRIHDLEDQLFNRQDVLDKIELVLETMEYLSEAADLLRNN